MASSSGTSSASLWGEGEDVKARLEQRKRRRMDSNRESARRSRMRKRKQLEDLSTEVERLQASRNRAVAAVGTVNQHLAMVEAENRVLRSQIGELSSRLQALNEMIAFINNAQGHGSAVDPLPWPLPSPSPLLSPLPLYNGMGLDVNPWSVSGGVNLHPLMASGDFFQCY